jgi:hypothetical protein
MAGLTKNLTANVFSVKAPSRLVVDIPNFNLGTNKKVLLANPYLSGIRLGVHPDKTRLVLDIKSNMIPVYDVVADQSRGALVVSFSLSSSGESSPIVERQALKEMAAPAQPAKVFPSKPATSLGGSEVVLKNTIKKTMPVPEFEPEPEVERPAPLKPEPKIISQPKMTNEEILAAMDPKTKKDSFVVKGNERMGAPEPAASEVISAPQEPVMPQTQTAPSTADTGVGGGGVLVSGILFQAPQDAPLGALVIEGTSLNDYSVSQRGANLYELVLKSAKLKGEHLTLPQFPPESFKGFEVVLANQVGPSVVVKIYVNDGVKLSPYLAQGKLWLKATN